MIKRTAPYTPGIWIWSDGSHREVIVGQGSLGCFVKTKTGAPALLTNSHVMFPHFEVHPSTGIYHPEYSACGCGGDHIAAPVYDRNKPAQPGHNNRWVGGYKDGHWYGGFTGTSMAGYRPDSGPKGYAKTGGAEQNVNASTVDCAIATLDPGTRYQNRFPTPAAAGQGAVGGGAPPVEAEVWITGANTDLETFVGAVAGQTPKPNHYVRVFTPRLNRWIFGTLLYKPIERRNHRFAVKLRERPGADEMVSATNDDRAFGLPDDMEHIGSRPTFDQFVILPRPKPNLEKTGTKDYEKFYDPHEILNFDHGDSGSVVIDHKGQVIGLLTGGYPFPEDYYEKPHHRLFIEYTSVTNVGTATPILSILEFLEITIPDHYQGTAPAGGPAVQVAVPGSWRDTDLEEQRRTLRRLRDRLNESRRGRLVLGKIAQHRSEARRLFASVRALSAAWRELNGPAFFHHGVRSLRDSRHVIPTTIGGVSRESALNVLLPLLARHASPPLRRDIERYRDWATDVSREIFTLDDVPTAIERRRVA